MQTAGQADEESAFAPKQHLATLVRGGEPHLEEFPRRLGNDGFYGADGGDDVARTHRGVEMHGLLAVQKAHHVHPQSRVKEDGSKDAEGERHPKHGRHQTAVAVGLQHLVTVASCGGGEGEGGLAGDGDGGHVFVDLANELLIESHGAVYVDGMPVVDDLLSLAPRYPERIVCLTEEPTETLYRLGLGDRVVGVSSFTLRPVEARSKPKISSFLDARFDDLVALKPDLVIGFSDLQGDIAAELCKRGIPVVIFNQRSVAEILQTIQMTASLVGAHVDGAVLVDDLRAGLQAVGATTSGWPRRPRVYFEEWADPCISAIRWVSELIEIAGGDDLFAATRARHDAKGRIISVDDVLQAAPDVIIASWCGKKVKRESLVERFAGTPAVDADQIYEIPSELILQPGPAALTDGLAALSAILGAVAEGRQLPPRHPGEARRGDL